MASTSNLPTIFGEVLERDVTFCIDTSGSMFNCLHVVKEHLIETLMKHAQRDGDTMFNIIEFNSEVTQWADKMVSCTPETVQVAAEWIMKLGAKTGTNTLDALLTALQESTCQAVYLVTDGLPDNFVEDILDTVIEATHGRPIHCIYLTGEKTDTSAVEFLEDLAVESFGSFHIVTVTTHGCVERITPIYRSEHANQRVIRTVNNTLHPNLKTCSVTTTLQIDPDDILGRAPQPHLLWPDYYPNYLPPWWHWRFWGLGMLPYRYYFPNTWSRYRPAKSWLQSQDKLLEPPEALGMSPAAGSLLIGKKVLARRIADGYFYMGTVQSQLLDEKFLVGFGPCKHGKFKDTTYQDTFVFDIVDYCDAQRHTIITGDHVLAPWEPEGERFGPGIVIDGQEKRQALGETSGPVDKQLTIAFSNGHTENVVPDKAIWIPQPVYERVSLELKMPKEARSTLMTNDQYPVESLPGYPTSGPGAKPSEFYTPEYFNLEPSLRYPVWDRCMYPEFLPFYPPYPLTLRRKQMQKETIALKEKKDEVIPGTDMTCKELDERVLSQLMEHKLVTGDRPLSADQQSSTRMLGKRQKQEENTLKKSVTFSDSDLTRASYTSNSLQPRSDASTVDSDSGIESWEMNVDSKRNEYCQQSCNSQDSAVNTDSSLLFYHSPGIHKRPSWKYWRNDPSPAITSARGGGSTGGKEGSRPFRETALQAPLEARDQRQSPYIVEWKSPAFKYVDTFAKHDHSSSVEECLRTPHPPKSGATGGINNFRVQELHPPSIDDKEEARRAYKRHHFIQRQMAWQDHLAKEDHMKALMQDGHRERIQAQIDRENERQQQESKMIENAREAKKKISKELRDRIQANQQREKEKEENRLNAMKVRRERREAMESQRDKEIEETVKRREEIRRQHCLARSNAVTTQLDEQDAKATHLDQQHRNAKIRRTNHFNQLEDQAQAKKDIRVAVTDKHLALYRSQIFP